MFRFMDIDIPYRLASESPDYDSNPNVLIENLDADTLYQEHDSRHYLRQAERYESQLQLDHPQYHQHFEGFEPGCCLLDVLFQFGPESFRITDQLH